MAEFEDDSDEVGRQLPATVKLAAIEYLQTRTDKTFKKIAWWGAGVLMILGVANISTCHDMTRTDELRTRIETEVDKASGDAKDIKRMLDEVRDRHESIARELAADPAFADRVRAELLPAGSIIAWNKAGDPPRGWVSCDGQNNTPNLNGLFIMGASIPGPSKDGVNTSGYDPGHTMVASWRNAESSAALTRAEKLRDKNDPTSLSNGTHNHSIPHYALRFIMKL